MPRVGLCRLNSEGAAIVQKMYRDGRRKGQWINVAAFCDNVGIQRSTYYELIKRDKWFERATIQDKLTTLGIPETDQAALYEFREDETVPRPMAPASLTKLPV